MSVFPRSVACTVLALAASMALATFADAQRAGDPVPSNHPSRVLLPRPVYTSTGMVLGSWTTVSLDASTQALSGAPRSFEIVVGESEVTISSPHDPYGPRSFGIVAARAVDSWIEYELRGQGGTYYLTAQLGTRIDGTRAALFVLSPPGSGSRTERFVVPEVDGTIALGAPAPPAAEPSPRPRRVDAGETSAATVRRVSAAELLEHADRRVTPVYPSAARSGSIEGTVVVEIVVDVKGKVAEAVAVAGHATLRSEAVRAAKLWRFKPFVFGSSPSSVRGQISFKFGR